MKKLTLFIAIFFIALVGKINAQTYYGITIAEVKVTSDNCDNITGENIEGKVSYNDATKTLTLDNATIEGDIGFDVGQVSDITITLLGANSVSTIWYVSGTKTINGTGSLKASGILCSTEESTIIEDCTIDINTGLSGAVVSGGDGSKLIIKNANISAEAGLCAIGDFKDIELIGCEIVEPVNAQIIDNEVEVYGITYAGKYICDADGNIAKKVVISNKIEKTTYTEELSAMICDNETYTFAGKELSTADVYYDTIHIDDKTDSIYILTLTVNPTYDTTIYDTMQLAGAGEDYDATKIDSLQTIYGCDSIITTITYYHYISGLEEVANENTISIYPNPAKDKVTIEGKGEVVITNSIGQVVKEIKGNNVYRTLNIKDLESGVYYIKVGEITQKLVVE